MTPRPGDLLDRRALNRALLERQLLSRRRRVPVLDGSPFGRALTGLYLDDG